MRGILAANKSGLVACELPPNFLAKETRVTTKVNPSSTVKKQLRPQETIRETKNRELFPLVGTSGRLDPWHE